jgi:hypothetical protein
MRNERKNKKLQKHFTTLGYTLKMRHVRTGEMCLLKNYHRPILTYGAETRAQM